MKPILSSVAAVAVFKFAFRASWKVALLAGALTYAVTGATPILWQGNDSTKPNS